MPFWRSYAHLIWATKDRRAFIVPTIERALYAQMVKKVSTLGCYVYAINGMPDHLHLVATVPPKISVADLVKNLKGSSAYFVNQVLRPPEFHFAWQRGYGYLTLGQKQLSTAIAYVERQKEHHCRDTAIAWLEKCTETDEGPHVTCESNAALREVAASYTIDEDIPF